ncbi:MAG: hypothetical protein A2287_08905 [Candidatus Melainabacteria bacterium RIFOXYA12_FULL_32_12]|nr:MAG: hypothetical protein A2255_02070 [Candidatus Melainabacteria bacterium RIFOXYA2_FULL_32_9]OGI26512.1 MAG: hypothetical protein A2287_08905 [Candidatus Melainabacteria bacterium RIFOXYA12_FULL_32_12]
MINPGNAAYDDNISNEIKEVLEVMEQLYDSWLTTLKAKKDNIKRINLDSIIELIALQKAKGEVKNRRDIIAYIDGIIGD